jgi:hypothetical protein
MLMVPPMVPQVVIPRCTAVIAAFRRNCGSGLRQQFRNCVNLKPRPQALMRSRPPHRQEDRVPIIRWIATVTAAALLSAGVGLLHPAAQAAPPSTPPAVHQPAQDPAPDAVWPPPPASSRKPHGGGRSAAGGNVMRGGDTQSLITMLPWWRPSRPLGSDPEAFESPILTACDLWLGFPFATAEAQSLTVRLAAAQHASEIEQVANKIQVADPGEINEIDLAAPDEPKSTGGPWLSGLLAVLGGALAAFSAVRYLMA